MPLSQHLSQPTANIRTRLRSQRSSSIPEQPNHVETEVLPQPVTATQSAATGSRTIAFDQCKFGCGRVIKNPGARKNHEKKCAKMVQQQGADTVQLAAKGPSQLPVQTVECPEETFSAPVNATLPGTNKVPCAICGQVLLPKIMDR